MEIERKFLVTALPDISGEPPIRYERYFLKDADGVQERIQKKGDTYELEIKRALPGADSFVSHEKEKHSITKEKFESLKQGKESNGIIRDGYLISENPEISIKIYHGRFEGLVRAEVEFPSIESAETYTPEPWMGEEITNSPLGMDARLLHLTSDEFKSLLERTKQ